MSTIKLHEATKQFKLSNKLAMFFLEKKNLAVKSHSSVITFDQLELLREFGAHPERFPDVMEALAGPAKKAKAAAGLKKEEKNKEADKKPAEEKKPAPVKAPVKEKAVPEKKPTKEAIKEKVEKPVAKKEVKEARPVSEGRKERTPAPVETKVPAAKAKEKIPEKREIPRVAPSPPPPPPPKRVVAPVSEPVKKAEVVALPERIQVPDLVTVKELADKLNCKLKFLEEKMTQLKMSYSSNELMETENLKKLCQELHVQLDILPFEDYVFASQVAQANAQPQPRPPVVTVMGHVDHGKTTLLDTLRKTRVAENEAGGITQKIGAYKLKTKDGMIVFIDTPGHEAFTNLRARGAKVTDIVILVVAANDGVQPQTVEAILHAQAAQVPMIVAINKIDLAGADPSKVKQELNKHNLLVEEWGGKVVSVEISAKLNQNLDTLLEMIHLVAQMQELKAYTGIPARGTVIESRLDPQLGPIGYHPDPAWPDEEGRFVSSAATPWAKSNPSSTTAARPWPPPRSPTRWRSWASTPCPRPATSSRSWKAGKGQESH